MKRFRFFFTEFLIVAPLLLVTVGATVFFASEWPQILAGEEARVRAIYREIAEDVKEDSIAAIRSYPRATRKFVHRLGVGSWDVEAIPAMTGYVLVWYHAPKAEEVRGVVVPSVPTRPLAWRYGLLGGAVVFVLLLLTDLGLRRYRRFMREREDFIAATAHDLFTPLAGLKHTIGVDDAEALTLVANLERLVSNLRTFLLRGGRLPAPTLTTFDLADAYDAAYRLFAADIRDLTDGADLPFESPVRTRVRADRQMTEQILWNLLANEVKYALPHGRVSVRIAEKGTRLALSFVDEGPGLSASDRRHIFNRYFRTRNAQRSGAGGFGLGLETARRLARTMNGDLTVRANHPHGCVFTIILPVG